MKSFDFHKKGTESGWSVADKDEIAVVMAMGNRLCFSFMLTDES